MWCAAGKGTFGTDELARRISAASLSRIVQHKRLIVPQLGAVGVSGFRVLKETGFKMHFGPVCANNCSFGALCVDKGVGCASAIINSIIYGVEPSCVCGGAKKTDCC